MSDDRGQRMTTPDARTLEDVIAAAVLGELICYTLPANYVRPHAPTEDHSDVAKRCAPLIAALVAEQVREHLASEAVRNRVAVALHDRIMPGQPHPIDEYRSERPCRVWADAALAATLGGVR